MFMPSTGPPLAKKAKEKETKLAMTCSKPKKAKIKMMKIIEKTLPASSFIRRVQKTAVLTTILAKIPSVNWVQGVLASLAETASKR